MNNKKGGAGAIVILVIILMIASAVGGAYGYRVLDGKLAVSDAKKAVADVDISDYDAEEQTIIQNYIDDATKDLDKCKTRKEVYDVLADFIEDVSKVKTTKDKKLEEALRQAENAKTQSDQKTDSTTTNKTGNDSTDSGNGNYKSNDLNQGSDGKDDDDDGFLGSLLGGLSSGSGN